MMRLTGWRIEGAVPDLPRFVLIGAPHTSNWDFIHGMAVKLALGLDVHWLAKHTLFRPPLGWLMRALGGLPVDRQRPGGLVRQVTTMLTERDQLIIGITPEGTRGRVDRWKTGFYRIAASAGVPIVPAYFDYARRVVGFGTPFYPTGDLEQDMAALRSFYDGFAAKHPERV